jgi:hypothetical protein
VDPQEAGLQRIVGEVLAHVVDNICHLVKDLAMREVELPRLIIVHCMPSHAKLAFRESKPEPVFVNVYGAKEPNRQPILTGL